MQITVTVETGNALTFKSDVLALKYAQDLYGVDLSAVELLSADNINLTDFFPDVHSYIHVNAGRRIGSKSVLFVGVQPLWEFGYQEIREFSRKVLSTLATEAPQTKHICLTLHGAEYRLDEAEAFESEVAGIVDAITSGNYPKQLQQISFVEQKSDRADRLRIILSRLLPQGAINFDERGFLKNIPETTSERLRSAGYASYSKPNIFVAMPFDEKMDDVFHYGIQGAVNSAGFLCERADLTSFTGDVMHWVKKRIRDATLVIADLTTANPNVFLEVGYAWGCGKPTILLVQDKDDLKFDVKGQRCLIYKKIKELEESLYKELNNLKPDLIK